MPQLKARIEKIRLALGPRMNLGDVQKKTVPKMCLVSPPRAGRRDLDAHVHSASRARSDRRARRRERRDGLRDARFGRGADVRRLRGEGGAQRSTSSIRRASSPSRWRSRRSSGAVEVRRSALLRTARKLMRGEVFVPGRVWSASMSAHLRVCLIGFGEVGQTLAADLQAPWRARACRRGTCSSRIRERPEPGAAATACVRIGDRRARRRRGRGRSW